MNKEYMQKAIELAKQGKGYTNPNPIVGAVIVKNNEVIGQGFHEKYGELHAERNALKDCQAKGNNPEGAEMYVTLEPCCHYGKTPPCTEAIIENKLAAVFIGSNDPNPLVAGKGIEQLRNAGITVENEILKEECDELNKVFFHYINTKRPYVTLKYAMTADGKIATSTGKSKWITGKKARAEVQQMRHENAAIMVGIGTALADDPMLNCRLPNGSNPIRIICDSQLRISMKSQIVNTAKEIRTIIAVSKKIEIDHLKEKSLKDAGCEIWKIQDKEGHVDLHQLVDRLGQEKIDSLFIEGGSEIAYSALSQDLVDRVMAFTAPKIFGGKTAKTPVGGIGVNSPNEAIKMQVRNIKIIGDDILTEYEVEKCLRE